MPIIKSAKKRVKIARKATIRNAKTKRNLRDALKGFSNALAGGSRTEIEKAERQAVSALDTAVKKDVIHKNKAARKKSQISAKAKAAGAKPSAKAKPVKPAVKKSPAKKIAAKKAPAKK